MSFQVQTFNWDQATQGIILSSYYWGYMLTNLPGGILSEKFGAKYVIDVAFFISIISMLITPSLLLYADGNWKLMVFLRIVCGCGEVNFNQNLVSLDL